MSRGTLILVTYAEATVADRCVKHYTHTKDDLPKLAMRNGNVIVPNTLAVEHLNIPWKRTYVRSLKPEEIREVCEKLPHADSVKYDLNYDRNTQCREFYYAAHPDVVQLLDIISGERICELQDKLLDTTKQLEIAMRRANRAEAEAGYLTNTLNTFTELPWYKRVWMALWGWQ